MGCIMDFTNPMKIPILVVNCDRNCEIVFIPPEKLLYEEKLSDYRWYKRTVFW